MSNRFVPLPQASQGGTEGWNRHESITCGIRDRSEAAVGVDKSETREFTLLPVNFTRLKCSGIFFAYFDDNQIQIPDPLFMFFLFSSNNAGFIPLCFVKMLNDLIDHEYTERETFQVLT